MYFQESVWNKETEETLFFRWEMKASSSPEASFPVAAQKR